MSKEVAYQKMAITSGLVSCGTCNRSVSVDDCQEKEEDLKDGAYSYRLTLIHKECGSVVAGADV